MPQRFFPMLAYADAPAAIKFLEGAFGFVETMRMDGDDGTVGHAELQVADQTLMVASAWRDAGMMPPIELSGVHSQIMVVVDDVDAHYSRAVSAGATIVDEPANQDYGQRTYRAVDPEGHRWIFASPLA